MIMKKKLEEFLKSHYRTLLFFGIVGLVGGFLLGLFTLDSYPEEMRDTLYEQGLNDLTLGVVTAVQSMLYGVILGAFGIFFGSKTGMFKGERRIERHPLTVTVIVAIVVGLSMILFDVLLFGRFSEAVMSSYEAKPTLVFILASILYGGVIEEVMLRLFLLSLVAFILLRIFGRGQEKPSAGILVASNVVASLLFAVSHLPATSVLLGITPMIVARCLLLNGGIGFILGYLYYRFGLRYSMIAHAGCHAVSKLIWILFI
jgi:membrane protease YdiL (CAAX protease family)